MPEQTTIEEIFPVGSTPAKSLKQRATPVFKKTPSDSPMLFPESLDDHIEQGDVVRFVKTVVEKLDLSELYNSYPGGGTSSFDPAIMLKVLLGCYTKKIYSSRRIAQALRENIKIMWLGRGYQPDFRTIALFRSGRLKKSIDKILALVVELLLQEGYIKIEELFIDGTKMHANANKNKVVWKKNAIRHKKNLTEKIWNWLDEIDGIEKEEQKQYGEKNLEEEGEGKKIDPEAIEKKIAEIKKKKISEETPPLTKKQTKLLNDIEQKHIPKIKQYENQIETAKQRSGYSKTDTDATMHRMKDGSLLPSYNVMISTSNRYVVNASIGQNSTDTTLLIPHAEKYFKYHTHKPKVIVGDAGFGSEENYAYADSKGIESYLKYNTFYQEEKRKFKNSPFAKDAFAYDQKEDLYICPQGRELPFTESGTKKTQNGYDSHYKRYVSRDCSGCPVEASCKPREKNKSIDVRPQLEIYKQRARQNLTSIYGKELRKRRNTEPETFNGDLKYNQGMRRFLLRGKEKVNVEISIMAMAYNLRKMAIETVSA